MKRILANGRRWVNGAALVAIVAAAASTWAADGARNAGSGGSARRAVDRLDSLLTAERVAEAVDLAGRMVRRHGDDPLFGWQLRARLGLALLRAGRMEDAVPHLEDVARRFPSLPDHHRNLATALLALGKRGRALAEFRQTVELAPDDAEAHLEYGQLLVEFGDLHRARSELEIAHHLCGECVEADRALAAMFLAAPDPAGAVAPLTRLMDTAPSEDVRRNLLAALSATEQDRRLLDLLQTREASSWTADEWRLAVQAEGRLLATARWATAAVAQLARASASPDGGGIPLADPVFWGRAALNLLESGQFRLGLEAADRAVALAPDQAVYHNNRAVLLQRLGREAEARLARDRARRLDPSLASQED